MPRAGRLATRFSWILLSLMAAIGIPDAAAGISCAPCGDEIRGRYARYEELGWNVCSTCLEAPRCSLCNLPRAGRLEGEGEVCSRCLESADPCTACGRPILERGWTVSGAEGKFCDRCRHDASGCSSCGAPAPGGRLVGGRMFCRTCRPQLLSEPAAVRDLYERVADLVRLRVGLEVDRLPELVIEDPDSLRVRGQRPRESESRLCGVYVRDGRGRARIHLLSHQTEARTAAVLAHELAHAWQAENCPDDQGTRVREGFAEWVAWKSLEGMPGTEEERAFIRAREDDYGLGFRMFARLEQRDGPEHAIWFAKAARSRLR